MENLETLTLSPDQNAVALRELQSAAQAISFVHTLLERGGAAVEDVRTGLGVAEHKLANFTDATGIATQSAADVEERSMALRKANMRSRELEKQLGAGITPTQIQAGVRALHDKLYRWWRLEGFGHVSSAEFGPYGCKLDLSCTLFGHAPSTFSKAPVSEKEAHALWLKSLAGRGFVLLEESRREHSLEDCPATRQALCDLIRLRFPGCVISETKNHGLSSGKFVLKGVTVYVRDLELIAALPDGPDED